MTKQVKRFYFIFLDIQTRSSYLTRILLCIIPHHSPSPSLRGKEDARALFLAGTHIGGNKKSRQLRQHRQHHPHNHARDGMDPCYTCTRIYPWVWIWYGIRSSPLRGWGFELASRRVELAGARRRGPKRARTLLRF